MGGLHKFMGWQRPMLTDSGGFQVFSLSDTRKIDDDGVTSRVTLTVRRIASRPRSPLRFRRISARTSSWLSTNVPIPTTTPTARSRWKRTHRWAERSLKAQTRSDQALFGIVQGGVQADLRTASAKFIASLDTLGIAIGGLSVGETKRRCTITLDVVTPLLPENKPRY